MTEYNINNDNVNDLLKQLEKFEKKRLIMNACNMRYYNKKKDQINSRKNEKMKNLSVEEKEHNVQVRKEWYINKKLTDPEYFNKKYEKQKLKSIDYFNINLE